jgi:hypothetical protein
MNDPNLKSIVATDKQHIINFLSVHNLQVKGAQVELLYSEGEGEPYLNLWEVEEPHLVKVQFIIERPKEVDSSFSKTLDLLIDKITTRAWPDSPYDPLAYTQQVENTCTHFRSIDFTEQTYGNIKIILRANICYCT